MLSLKLAQVFCAQYSHNFFNDHIIIKTSIIEVFLQMWQNFSMTWYALLDIPGWQIFFKTNLKKKLSIHDSNVTILFEQNTSIQKNINIDKGVCMELTVFWDEWGMTSIQDFMSGFTFKVYSLHCFLYVWLPFFINKTI